MTDQRMIGDILSERRHSLGLSIDRVVGDTKLQRRMVEAFESSDFDAMPPKGYAQASLASYARYLGLNPNEILRIYDDQLYDYQRMTSSSTRTNNRRAAVSEEPRRARSSRFRDEEETFEREDERGYDSPSRRRSTSSYRERNAQRNNWDRDDRDDERTGGRYGSRSYERGLYESGHRRSERAERPTGQRSSRYEEAPSRRSSSSRSTSSYRDDRYDRSDSERGRDRTAGGSRSVSVARVDHNAKHNRGETQIVTLDDGYQGGSGGPDSRDADIYRPRPSRRTTDQRQSLSEVAQGFLNAIRRDPRAFPIIVGVVALTIIIVLAVSISSCVRGGGNSNEDNTIPVTPMANMGATTDTKAQSAGDTGTVPQSTPLEPSIDLNAIPANSILALSVNADAPTGPWIEVYIDDVGVHAQITPPGTNLQWTITRTATVKLSSIEYVQIFVNGVQVTPTLDNGTYVLTLNVPQDQWPQAEPAEGEGAEGGYYDEAGNWIEG